MFRATALIAEKRKDEMRIAAGGVSGYVLAMTFKQTQRDIRHRVGPYLESRP